MTATALCVRIKRPDGRILRATTHDVDILVTATGYAGTYRSAAALSPSAIQSRATLAVDGLELDGVLTVRSGITPEDVAGGLYDMARATLFEVDWSDPSTVTELAYGVLGNKKRTHEGRLTMELRSISQLLAQVTGDVYSVQCRATLGSGSAAPVLRRCGVDLAAFTFDEDVTAVGSTRRAFTCGNLSNTPELGDSGYFSKGRVIWLSGANIGVEREIRLHDETGLMILYEPTPADIEVDDEVRLIAGCDKTLTTCRDKFDNVVNFRGEPFIPGAGYVRRLADRSG